MVAKWQSVLHVTVAALGLLETNASSPKISPSRRLLILISFVLLPVFSGIPSVIFILCASESSDRLSDESLPEEALPDLMREL